MPAHRAAAEMALATAVDIAQAVGRQAELGIQPKPEAARRVQVVDILVAQVAPSMVLASDNRWQDRAVVAGWAAVDSSWRRRPHRSGHRCAVDFRISDNTCCLLETEPLTTIEAACR